jgi:hypothetical protein
VGKHATVIATAVLALSVFLPTTAAAAAECTWTVEAVTPPEGYPAQSTYVTGTDSAGNYSGWALGTSNSEVVLWAKGEPRTIALPDFYLPIGVDQNHAGTVLLQALRSPDGGGVYTYSAGGVLSHLPLPDGYEQPSATAINNRGDVLGAAVRTSDSQRVTLLWSDLAAGPIVIDGEGVDIDDDGTVLLGDGHLWRGGVLTPLPSKQTMFNAIQQGSVVGTQVVSWPESDGLLWHGATDPRPLEMSGTADEINAHGLIAGSLTDLTGPPAVWRDTTLLGTLPLPTGATDAETFVIGDDDVIFGQADNNLGPVRWHC